MVVGEQYGEVAPVLRRRLRSVLAVWVPCLLGLSAVALSLADLVTPVPVGPVLGWLTVVLSGLGAGLYALLATADVAVAAVHRIERFGEIQTRQRDRSAGTLSLVEFGRDGALSAVKRRGQA